MGWDHKEYKRQTDALKPLDDVKIARKLAQLASDLRSSGCMEDAVLVDAGAERLQRMLNRVNDVGRLHRELGAALA